jgi:type III pantothenate kinase
VDLLVDVGNSRIKWALRRDGVLGPAQSMGHGGQGLAALAFAWDAIARPGRVIIASVAKSAVRQGLAEIVTSTWGLTPEFLVTPTEAGDVKIGYPRPERLGVDRWLGMVAVFRMGKCPALVVDCGSAVTLDVIDAAGQHLGGMIVPGLEAMRQALFASTTLTAEPSIDSPPLLGTDTLGCIASGSLQAIVGLIERTPRQVEGRYGIAPRLVVAGGDGPRISAQLEAPHELMPDLVLLGLSLERN